MRKLAYDVYYSYAKSEDESSQEGAASRSRYAQALLRVNGADPVANIFGQNLSDAAVDAILIHSTNITNAEQQVAAAWERDPHTIGEWLAEFRRVGPAGLHFVRTGGSPPPSTSRSRPR